MAPDTGKPYVRKGYIKRVNPPHRSVVPGEKFYDEIVAYQGRFTPMIDAEQHEEEVILHERLANRTLEKLKQEGYTLTGLEAYWTKARDFGRPVASFSLGAGIELPDHKFEVGSQVLLTRFDKDPLEEVPYEGSIMSRTTTQLRIAFPELFDIDQGPWRLDLGRSNFVYDRMRKAITYLHLDPQAQESYVSVNDRQLILQGTHLRDVLLRSFTPVSSSPSSIHIAHTPAHVQPEDDPNYVPHSLLEHEARHRTSSDHGGAFKDDMRIQSWARRYMRPNPIQIEGDPVLEGLNQTQLRAVAMMIGERACLVQGPPGTGKTKTIIETIKLLKVHFQVPHPLLVCTYTNVAVDNLVEGFHTAGVKPLRVGSGDKLDPKSALREHSLEAKLEKHPLRPELDRVNQDADRLRKSQGTLEKKIKDLSEKIALDPDSKASTRARMVLDNCQQQEIILERRLNIVVRKLYALRQEMLRDIVAQADVVCTTCITSWSNALCVIDFPVVFLDEASMSTEPASLIPIMKGSRHLALIGDHKQLPPVITSDEARVKGLGISLFERLTEEGDVPSIMLDVQYRMHPAISQFPSREFYNLSLLDGTVDEAGNVRSSLLPPMSSHLVEDPQTRERHSVVFVDHAGQESFKDKSWINWEDARIVVQIVEDLLLNNPGLKCQDIGIIAPYVAQISLLSRLLHSPRSTSNALSSVITARLHAALGDHRSMQLPQIEIKTVDGFEGREKEIIIFSTVRNNNAGRIGFLADRRRLNVGLTRAKRGLFVVGSLRTLKESKRGRRSESLDGGGKVDKGSEAWRNYVQWLGEKGLVRPIGGGKREEEGAEVRREVEMENRERRTPIGGYAEEL